jgi:hypothetical protein
VSRTTTVTFAERGFWSLDDAFAVWLAYLVEEADRADAHDDPWCVRARNEWRVASGIPEFGAHIPRSTPDQLSRLLSTAAAARQRAQARGDLSIEDLQAWIMVDDLAVSGGFSRTGAFVEVNRVIEVAVAFIALIDGTLPADPPEGAWFVGRGRGYEVMPHKGAPFAPGQPRFPHIAD